MATLHLPHFHRGGPHPRLEALRGVLWTLTGAVVLVFIFSAALGGLEPGDAEVLVVAVCVLAVLWAAHAWRRLWDDERLSGRS
jgi:hypothetical protein